MKKLILLVVLVLATAIVCLITCNKFKVFPTAQLEAKVDSVFQQKKLVVGAINYTPTNVRYTEHLTYDGTVIPFIGRRGFTLDPNGTVTVHMGYDMAKDQKFADIISAKGKLTGNHPVMNLTVRLYPPQAVIMDARADVIWDASWITGKPTSEEAYGFVQDGLFQKANQEVEASEDLRTYAQSFLTEWYLTAFQDLTDGRKLTLNITFENGEVPLDGKSNKFALDRDFEWTRDSSVVLTQEKAEELMREAGGGILDQLGKIQFGVHPDLLSSLPIRVAGGL